ncbi:MAG TPA: four-carbon acid sugar kinase family protein [Geminicoccaceae bacterium]|nr:four-carbon acid sugar kinase family protein [Geminicoccaceae bacterium]
MTTVRIIADDLTGALDAAAPFVAVVGPLPVLWDAPSNPGSGDSFALDTETRDAKELGVDWLAGFHGADVAFKKIDSLLRGRTVDEIAACLESGLFESVLIAPAFPMQQRITRHGQQHWRAGPDDDWQPVDCDLVAALTRRRAPIRRASSAAEIGGRGSFLCDAATEADLRAIVSAGSRLVEPVLWIGTAGLARVLAGPPAEVAPTTLPAPLLLVVGSHHPVTRAQVERLAAHAPEAITTVRPGGADLVAAVEDLAAGLDERRRAALVLELPDGTGGDVAGPWFDRVMDLAIRRLPAPGSLVVTGGATLHRLVRTLSARSLLVVGEPLPGIARSRLEGGRWPGATVVSKSGAFGAPELLVRWWKLVHG